MTLLGRLKEKSKKFQRLETSLRLREISTSRRALDTSLDTIRNISNDWTKRIKFPLWRCVISRIESTEPTRRISKAATNKRTRHNAGERGK